jgi:hypothetical protein
MGAQKGEAAAHTVVHAPLLVASARTFSQPSAGVPLQSAWPGLHAVTMHCRSWHPVVLCVEGHALQLGSPHP